jgi:predicted transcriptional regulator
MLNAIFGSISRVKILNLLLLSPEKEYSLKDLTIKSGLTNTAIHKELNNLIKFGLVLDTQEPENEINKHHKKRKTIYSINNDFLLYPEIKALFTKAQIVFSQTFVEDLQKICQPKFLALTGLFTNFPEAQTDILLVGTVRRSAFLKILKNLEKNLGREINYTILSKKEFSYRQNIMDIFLYNILEGKTIVLINKI